MRELLFADAEYHPEWARSPSRDYNQTVEFALRDFRQEEFETLWRIDQQCFAPGISYSRLELAMYLQRPGAFALVADTSEEIRFGAPRGSLEARTPNQGRPGGAAVGFIVAETGSRGNGHIITIDVLPHARGAGIGSRLLLAAEGRLRDFNCQAVILEAAVDNSAALSFYKRHQYYVVKMLPGYYSNGLDGLVLKKDLLSPPPPAKLPQ